MKLQHQTTFGGPSAEPDDQGNCFATCIACILDMDVAGVPNFVSFGDDWWDVARHWLAKRGWRIVNYNQADRDWLPPDAVTIAVGITDVGAEHAVLVNGYGLVHDPLPDGVGLAEVLFQMFLIPIDPSEFERKTSCNTSMEVPMPGEIADAMLDGSLCEGCGEYLGDGPEFPRLCADCSGYAEPEAKDDEVDE